MEKAVELILNKLGVGLEIAVPLYAKWYIINSIMWILMSIPCFAISYICYKKSKKADWDEERLAYTITAIGLSIVGSLFIAGNIADIFCPEARAIHEILKDCLKK